MIIFLNEKQFTNIKKDLGVIVQDYCNKVIINPANNSHTLYNTVVVKLHRNKSISP
jgi:hypothetical protein